MAIFDKQIHNGIQLGKHLDVCQVCYGPGSKFEYGEQEYKEVFKLHIAGLEYIICLDHFKEMLGDYTLVHKDELKTAINKTQEQEPETKTTKKKSK